MSEKDLARITVYLPPTIKDRLQDMAKREGRSMNDLIVQWVNDGLKADSLEEAIINLTQRVKELENKK